MLKRTGILIAVVLLLCLATSALADGVNVEVIVADGVSVVLLTPESTVQRARRMTMSASGEEAKEGFVLPEKLAIIGEEAFAGIAAERVEVTENVVAIERRAFADCKFLREIFIPELVKEIDKDALEGCENVTVYGVKGSAAEAFAAAAGFKFIDVNGGTDEPDAPSQREKPPVELPLIQR